MNSRFEIEQCILGACLLENSFGQVASILRIENFTELDPRRGNHFDHQKIFRKMMELFPTTPIDILTIANGFPKSERDYCLALTTRVSSSAHIKSWALILLQECFREQFILLLNSHKGFDKWKSTVIDEIIDEALDYSNDIFSVIRNSIQLKSDQKSIVRPALSGKI